MFRLIFNTSRYLAAALIIYGVAVLPSTSGKLPSVFPGTVGSISHSEPFEMSYFLGAGNVVASSKPDADRKVSETSNSKSIEPRASLRKVLKQRVASYLSRAESQESDKVKIVDRGESDFPTVLKIAQLLGTI